MTVRCSGDCRSMEQVGEKQDFETALTQQGLRHEDFMLSVHRSVGAAHVDAWMQDYTVTVAVVSEGAAHRYAGGPRHDWVAQFVIDVGRGVYGLASAAESARDVPCGTPPSAQPRSNVTLSA